MYVSYKQAAKRVIFFRLPGTDLAAQGRDRRCEKLFPIPELRQNRVVFQLIALQKGERHATLVGAPGNQDYCPGRTRPNAPGLLKDHSRYLDPALPLTQRAIVHQRQAGRQGIF